MSSQAWLYSPEYSPFGWGCTRLPRSGKELEMGWWKGILLKHCRSGYRSSASLPRRTAEPIEPNRRSAPGCCWQSAAISVLSPSIMPGTASDRVLCRCKAACRYWQCLPLNFILVVPNTRLESAMLDRWVGYFFSGRFSSHGATTTFFFSR